MDIRFHTKTAFIVNYRLIFKKDGADMKNNIIFGLVFIVVTLFLFTSRQTSAQSSNGSMNMQPSVPPSGSANPNVGIDEKTGDFIPMNLQFKDEKGKIVFLKDLVNKPTIISLIFLRCRMACPMLLGGLATALGTVQLKPGEDYHSLTISFDPDDTPKIAAEAKVNYIAAVGKPYPESAWSFLTGDQKSIKEITDSVGFRFEKSEMGFSHPVGLIILSPKGKITRYLYGTSFNPFDLTMALAEASEEREGISVKKVLLYCFSYDPEEKKYVLNILRVMGTATIIFVVALFIFLVITSRRSRKREG